MSESEKETKGENSPIQNGFLNINIVGRKKLNELYEKIVDLKKDLPIFFNENKVDLKNIMVQILQNSFLEIKDNISNKINESTSVMTEVFEYNYQKCHDDFESWYNENKGEFEKVFEKFEEFKDNQVELQKFIETENIKLQTQMAESFIVLSSMQTNISLIKDCTNKTLTEIYCISETMRRLKSSSERKETYLLQILSELEDGKSNEQEFCEILKNMFEKILQSITSLCPTKYSDLAQVENQADSMMQLTTDNIEGYLKSGKDINEIMTNIRTDIKKIDKSLDAINNKMDKLSDGQKTIINKLDIFDKHFYIGNHGSDCEKCGGVGTRIYRCSICGYSGADGEWLQKHTPPPSDWYKKPIHHIHLHGLLVVSAMFGLEDVYLSDWAQDDRHKVRRIIVLNNVRKVATTNPLISENYYNIRYYFPNLERFAFQKPNVEKVKYILGNNFFENCLIGDNPIELYGMQYLKDAGVSCFKGLIDDNMDSDIAENRKMNFIKQNNIRVELKEDVWR